MIVLSRADQGVRPLGVCSVLTGGVKGVERAGGVDDSSPGIDGNGHAQCFGEFGLGHTTLELATCLVTAPRKQPELDELLFLLDQDIAKKSSSN
jgi:hypothetical protein